MMNPHVMQQQEKSIFSMLVIALAWTVPALVLGHEPHFSDQFQCFQVLMPCQAFIPLFLKYREGARLSKDACRRISL